MGSSFANLHVRDRAAEDIVPALLKVRLIPAFLTSARDGWTSVYPQPLEEAEPQASREAAEARLSHVLRTAVLCVTVHDSDVFLYHLWEDGKCIDRYDSEPGIWKGWSEPPSGGDPRVLLRFCRPGTRIGALDRILRHRTVGRLKAVFAEELAAALARCLGLPSKRAVLGHTCLEQGESQGMPTFHIDAEGKIISLHPQRRGSKSRPMSKVEVRAVLRDEHLIARFALEAGMTRERARETLEDLLDR
jgi:hypothetical protein